MLKKAGIVIAAIAATTVAAAPLAFAGDYPKSHEVHEVHHHHSSADHGRDYNVDIDYDVDNSVDHSQSNRCSFGQNSVQRGGLLGVVSLLGQTQALNCTNIGDVKLVEANVNP